MEKYIISYGALKDGSGYIILTDTMHWLKFETELKEWCNEYLSLGTKSFVGSIIEFRNEEELVLFMLRWS